MLQLDEALQLVSDIIEKKNHDKRIYQRSNEYLKFIFDNLDVNGKDVFTVLGSSDQLLAFLYGGANNVDTFDINPLTEYYYYLRKWCLLQKITYPLDIDGAIINRIVNDLKANSEKEQNAIKFWQSIFQKLDWKHSNLFYSARSDYECDFPLDNIIIDFAKIISKVSNKNINFENINLLEEFNLSKKYDYIFASNILQRSQYDKKSLEICANNFRNILKNDGVVVCTNFIEKNAYNNNYYDDVINFEKEIMSDFIFNDQVAYNPIVGEVMPIYYTYTKK